MESTKQVRVNLWNILMNECTSSCCKAQNTFLLWCLWVFLNSGKRFINHKVERTREKLENQLRTRTELWVSTTSQRFQSSCGNLHPRFLFVKERRMDPLYFLFFNPRAQELAKSRTHFRNMNGLSNDLNQNCWIYILKQTPDEELCGCPQDSVNLLRKVRFNFHVRNVSQGYCSYM